MPHDMRLWMPVKQQQRRTLATTKRMEMTRRPFYPARRERLKHQHIAG
jgi:hypothetical protein